MGASSRDSHLWRFVQYLICLSAKKRVVLSVLKPEKGLNVLPLSTNANSIMLYLFIYPALIFVSSQSSVC